MKLVAGRIAAATGRLRRPWPARRAGQALALLCLLALASLLTFAYLLWRPPPAPAATDRLKIFVSENGIYRLTPEMLAVAGFDAEMASGRLRLSTAGSSVPYLLDDGALIFYGQAPASRYAAERPYVLESGRPGVLMPEVEARPQGTPLATVGQRLRLEANLIYDSRARPAGGGEPWFWQTLQVQSQLAIPFDLTAAPAGPATLRLALWGASHNPAVEPDHDFDVWLNGRTLGAARWDGESYHLAELTVPADLLRPGVNELLLDNTPEGASAIDITRLDWLELVYQAAADSQDGRLAFSAAGAVSLGGLSGRPVILDVADPAAPRRLAGWEQDGATVRLQAQAAMQIVAAGEDGLLRPSAVAPLRQSNWADNSRQADLLIIAPSSLTGELEPLVAARASQGLTAVVVPLEDIYDEFGFGQAVPDSVAAFVRQAYDHWSAPRPRYLLLVGDATYDYRGYLGPPPAAHLPSPMVPVSYSGETVSDARLADVNSDGRPELAVGRWPVNTVREVAALVERTLAYERGAVSPAALFAADGAGAEFGALSDAMLVASGFPQEQVVRLYGVPAAQLVEAWGQGAWLVSYIGHGSLDRWGRDDVLSGAAVPGLRSPAAPPLVLQFTCLTGFFAHPAGPSISETMLLHNGGPVLLVAATSLTLSTSQEPFAVALLRQLQDPRVTRIGDALQAAKLALNVTIPSLQEISDTFGLLGDPSAVIIRPPPSGG